MLVCDNCKDEKKEAKYYKLRRLEDDIFKGHLCKECRKELKIAIKQYLPNVEKFQQGCF